MGGGGWWTGTRDEDNTMNAKQQSYEILVSVLLEVTYAWSLPSVILIPRW